jgi:hypothetical protein
MRWAHRLDCTTTNYGEEVVPDLQQVHEKVVQGVTARKRHGRVRSPLKKIGVGDGN